MAKPEAINKVRFLIIGEQAPNNSRFKGTITSDSIFGSGVSVFNYSSRYAKEESDKDFDFDSIFDYSGRYKDNKINFTMSSDGKLDTKEKLNKFIDNGKQLLNKDGAILWEFVFSPKDISTSDKYNLSNQNDYASVVSKILPNYLKQIGFDPNNVVWWQDYHPDNRTSIEPHPHIHLYFFEKNQERTRGKLQRKDLNLFKRLMANEMIKRQDKQKYSDIFNDVNKNKKLLLDYSKKFNLNNIKSVRDLYKVLPSEGRLQYNSANMIGYRKAIDKVVNELLNSDDCKEAWTELNNKLDEYEKLVNTINGDNLSTRKETEITKLKVEIANHILSEKKNYIENKDYYKDDPSSKSKTLTKSGKGSKGKSGINIKLGTNDFHKPIKRFINGAIAKRQREIEDEIDEFLKNINKGYDKY